MITTGSTLLAEQQTNTLTFKPIIGGWVLGLMLFITATFADDLARAFAILVMVTAVLINGAKVFEAINKATGATLAGPNNPSSRTLTTVTSRAPAAPGSLYNPPASVWSRN